MPNEVKQDQDILEVVKQNPEAAKILAKIMAKRETAMEKAKENVRANYPYADADSIRQSPHHDHLKEVDVTCVKCGTVHVRHTGDLKQCKGICPDCKKQEKTAAKEERKKYENAARKLARGEISPEEFQAIVAE
jgi:formylmethanofuran dehydrogenase subunit E